MKQHAYPSSKIKLLDHGFIRKVESWGVGDAGLAEAGIIEAARQSTQGSFRGWEEDAKLLAFLHNNKHATPFEFAGLVIEVKAPILVFREWHRHRTQSYNEMSARYVPMPNENYVPSIERIMMNAGGTNKQAGTVKGAEVLTKGAATYFRKRLETVYDESQMLYTEALDHGIPKELARLCIPVARYSQMRASANLRNWLAFLTLRMDPAAQWEIRAYANALGEIIAETFPQTWNLFMSKKGESK